MKEEAIVPNFFIIGAIKSGTTTLTNYLIRHPQVFMPGIWEFNYLCSELNWLKKRTAQNDEEYLSHFSKAKGKKVIGEKSVLYLYSKIAAQKIKELNPNVKLICILRKPTDLLWSLFKYNITNFEEDVLDFEKALSLEEERIKGNLIPNTATFAENLFYRKLIDFKSQLEYYYSLFDKNQILVLSYNDLKEDSEKVYREILDFLDLEYYPLPEQKAYNKGGEIQLHYLRKFLAGLPSIKKVWNKTPDSFRSSLKKIFLLFGGKQPQKLEKMDENLRLRLEKETQPIVDYVEKLTGKKL